MFGHHGDNDVIQPDPDNSGTPAHDASSLAVSDDASAPQTDDQSWQHPGEPLDHAPDPVAEAPVHSEIISPTPSSTPVPQPLDDPKPVDDIKPTAEKLSTPDKGSDTDIVDLSSQELIELKQKALGELSPLMGHLDQTPEEKFRTTMMMIQASDDQTLVKTAYEAAQQITDEKVRAQALLDIVNEINYFTQQSNS